MIIGGKSAAAYTDSVELYNWNTGAQCSLASLPEPFGLHSGTILDGIPVICGGTTGTVKSDCYEFDKKIKNWLRVIFLRQQRCRQTLLNVDGFKISREGSRIFYFDTNFILKQKYIKIELLVCELLQLMLIETST